MRKNSYLLTDKAVTRIRALQNEKKLSNMDVANIARISLNQYKNIIKANHQKSISSQIAELLAKYYKCTIDYLIGDSDEPYLDKEGHEHRPAISFFHDEIRYKIDDYIQNEDNSEFTRNLYFLLYQLRHEDRTNYIASFNSTMNMLRMSTPISNPDFISSATFDHLRNCLLPYDNTYKDKLEELVAANKVCDSGTNNIKASVLYLNILLSTTFQTKDISIDAASKLLNLYDRWKSMPKKYETICEMLRSELSQNQNTLFLSNELKNLINEYINEYNNTQQ